MKKLLFLFIVLLAAEISFGQHSIDKEKLLLDLKVLSADDMQGRDTDSEGSKKAREYILGRLKELGAAPFVQGYLQPFTFNGSVNGNNILAVIPGKKKETIVLSAHYDHVGIQNNQIYNGADDNASGVAALLAILKYYKKNQPEHRIIFAFFDAEEKGLKGSAHFVKTINLQKESIVLNINLDMVGRNDKNELYASGGFHYPVIKSILEKEITPEGIKLLFGHDDPLTRRNDWTTQSDQYHFHLKKIPFVFFSVEDHADYHKPTDDFEKINPVFFSNSTETILRCVKSLDGQFD